MENRDNRHTNEQEQNKNENIIPREETVEIKSQENVLSGLSETERAQAAEEENKNLGAYGNDTDSSTNATVNGGLSEKERADAAEADGKIGDETKGGLSDKERRDAADESW